MSYTFSWLCCWSSMLLCLWGVSAGDLVLSSSSPPTDSSANIGLRGYRRYFANDSLVGRPVPCTRDDKTCFRHNLVYDPKYNSCSPIRYFYVNRTEFEQGSGRFVGATPKYADPCPGYRMAYDGVCYESKIVEGVICGRNVNITQHPFGGKECRQAQSTQTFIQQPTEDGSCVVPDFRFPDTERRVFYNSPYPEIQGFKNDAPNNFTPKALECGPDQRACFSKFKVFVHGFEGCHKLLERGPCAEDHVVALDLPAATQGRAEGTCVHVRGGCPTGYKRMLFDGQCHEDREIEIEAPSNIMLNQFGNFIVTFSNVYGFYPSLKGNFCIIGVTFSGSGAGASVISPPCGATDKSGCKSYQVSNEPPKPAP